jgi:catechol 2,3-dioxygenase-like lactoylglutathione lyase family enzyme
MGCHESTCAFTIRRVTRHLHTMYPITDPEKNREFYEALGLEFRRDIGHRPRQKEGVASPSTSYPRRR